MATTPLHYQSLMEVSRRIHQGEISSREVTGALLERIDGLDSRLHAFSVLTADQAISAAAAADAEIAAGDVKGPLHGVPIAVKDLCRTRGVRTRAGMPLLNDYIPDYDATAVARLRSAGAVILGKLELTEGAFAFHHPDVVSPLNPWGAGHWAGASSSGSGAATAAGLCYGSLGSDTGGSIPLSVPGLRPDRAQADLGTGQPTRGVHALRHPRPSGADDPHGGGRRRHPRGHRRFGRGRPPHGAGAGPGLFGRARARGRGPADRLGTRAIAPMASTPRWRRRSGRRSRF